MPLDILMPALSPTMTEGKLANWLVKEGDNVSSGDVMAEIETDKATMEVEAVDEGIIAKILIQAGTEGVAVNTPIAILAEEDESVEEALANYKPASEPSPSQDTKADTPSPAPTSVPSKPQTTAPRNTGRIIASPLAKRIAKQNNLDLAAVTGTGPNGRIVKADVDKALAGGGAAQATAQPNSTPMQLPANAPTNALFDSLGMSYEPIENSGMRKTIASRLLESKQTIPHFYLSLSARIDKLLALRKEMNAGLEAKGQKLSVNDFVVKACAKALEDVPAANAAWTDSHILRFTDVDLSIAVALDDGLITPIVKAAQGKSISQISDEVKDLAGRARSGSLKPSEYQGGNFTISNLGMYGIDQFNAIINPPQACILAVGAGTQQPIVENGQIVIGTMMTVTLSSDHRVVDGAVGAQFLSAFKTYIETPTLMFV